MASCAAGMIAITKCAYKIHVMYTRACENDAAYQLSTSYVKSFENDNLPNRKKTDMKGENLSFPVVEK